MSLPQKFYLDHMHQHTSYRANWLPDKPLRLGDIGKVDDGLFTLYTTLEQQQIKCTSRETESLLQLDYTSSDAVKIDFNVDAGAPATPVVAAKGKIDIQFTRNNGVVFQITRPKERIIENLDEISAVALKRYRDRTWSPDWVIITEIVHTDNATIIISTGSNNSLTLECDVNSGIAKIPLADPSANLKLVRETGSSTKIIGAAGLTPLYRIMGIKAPLWRNPKFTKRTDLTGSDQRFQELPYDEEEVF